MKPFTYRRCRNIALLLLVAAGFVFVTRLPLLFASRQTFSTGWLLLAIILLLAGYNLRKRLPFLPLFSSASWLQFHIYAGLFTILVFGVHIGGSFSGGTLEALLALIYLVVFTSGVVGLAMSRGFARGMTTRGSEVLYARIPAIRQQLQHEVETLVLECVAAEESDAVAEFYQSRLHDYFSAPRNVFAHLFQSRRPRRKMLEEMRGLNRYLNGAERAAMQRIGTWAEQKDDLDYQYAVQSALKYWLFLHIPMTYALLIFAFAHVVLIYAYTGGMR